MKAVLVTGSRNYAGDEVWRDLSLGRPDVVIHGDARGADTAAREWCAAHSGVNELRMPAQWDEHGKAAGPIRNGQMARVMEALRACGYECVVHAYPIGRSPGTRGCMAALKTLGFPVVITADPSPHPD